MQIRILAAVLLCFTVSFIQARQLHTIKSGSWEADSVWFNQITPGTTGDTIFIQHAISLHSNIMLGANDYLYITDSAKLCGNVNLIMRGFSTLVNEGFLGLHYFEIDTGWAYNINGGQIDIGDSGLVTIGDGYFLDSLACLLVHIGAEQCQGQCNVDTALQINVSQGIATFQTGQSGAYYEYYFSDGGTISTSDSFASYTFRDSGTYVVKLVIFECCVPDTIDRIIHITYEAPQPCRDDSALYLYPNPANEGFNLVRTSCVDEQVKIKVYAMTGQLVYLEETTTLAATLNSYVPTFILASACYIVEVDMGLKKFRRKLLVVHP